VQETIDQQHSIEIIAAKNVNKSCLPGRGLPRCASRSSPRSVTMRPRPARPVWPQLASLAACVCWVGAFRFLLLEHASSRLPGAPAAAGRALREAGGRAETVRVGDRSFLLWAPEDARNADALVVFVHGFTGRPHMWASVAQRVAARGWVAAAPFGLDASWNGHQCCGPSLAAGVDDVGFLRTVVDAVRRRATFRKVFGLGFSNGGFLVSAAAQVPGLFDAVAPFGGHTYEILANATPTPIFLSHGARDGVVRPGGCCAGARCCCGIDDAWGRECRPVQRVFDLWRSANRCGRGVANVRDDARVTCATGLGCLANTTLCVHHALAHEVPGLHHRRRPGADPGEGGVTVDDALAFFGAHV